MATGITEKDVWQAADALLLEGARPTIERVRQKIGRGSPNTVQPHLDTWFKGLGARIRDPGAFSASSDVPDPVTQAAKYFWDVARAEAGALIETQMATERAAIERARAELDQATEAFAQREVAMQAQVDTATSALTACHQQMDSLREREAQSRQALVKAESESVELRAALENQRQQLNEARATFDEERREAASRAQASEQHWLMEVDRLRQDLKKAQGTSSSLNQQLGVLQESLVQASAEGSRLAQHATALQDELARVTRQYTDARERGASLEDRVRQGDAEMANLKGALTEARRQRSAVGAIARFPKRPRLAR